MSKITRKLVIVGDGGCGKTALLMAFALAKFSEIDTPTTFDSFVGVVEVDGKYVELPLMDTPGNEEHDRLRPLAYPYTHVILVCFAINSRGSLRHVQDKWIPEVKQFCAGVPIILVGCKKDLRQDAGVMVEERKKMDGPLGVVTPREGIRVGQKIGAKQYLECSAKTSEGVREVFQRAAEVALICRPRKGSKKGDRCVII